MADSKVKDTVAYQLGELSSRTESLQEGVNDLSKRVDAGFERQRQEMKDGLEKQSQETGSLRHETSEALQRIDDRFDKFNERFDKLFELFYKFQGAVLKLGSAVLIAVCAAAAAAFFSGVF